MATGTVHDPSRKKLIETRKAIVDRWMQAAEILDRQGEMSLAGDVRYFAKRLPTVLTHRERLAAGILGQVDKRRASEKMRGAQYDLTR